jgi:hypothetical protein
VKRKIRNNQKQASDAILFSLGISGKPELLGPIVVPEAATGLLGERWEISCSLGRVGSEWRILEVANVYPA